MVGARGCWAAVSIRGWWWGLELQPRGCWVSVVVGVSCRGLMVLVLGIGVAAASFGRRFSWPSVVRRPSSDVVVVRCRLVSFRTVKWASGVGMEG